MSILDVIDDALGDTAYPDDKGRALARELQLELLEDDWHQWLADLFPEYVRAAFAEHHVNFWEWAWAIERDAKPQSRVEIWSRGGAKSTSAELFAVSLGARELRTYGFWVCDTQRQANDHMGSIATLLESARFGERYPAMAERKVNKYGQVRGYRQDRLRTASGFTIDAVGLDVAVRGAKMDWARPDFIIFDDLDKQDDGPAETERKLSDLSHAIIPAADQGRVAILAIQNLVHRDGIFARLRDGRADFLADRVVTGPIPAVRDLVTGQREGRTVIVSGEPTWEGQDLDTCQAAMDDAGVTAFMAEYQHNVDAPPGGMFDHVTFDRCTRGEYDALRAAGQILDVAVWVDPAVTNKDSSDCQGAQLDAVGVDGTLYRVRSWEQRSSPLEAIKLAIRWAIDEGATKVGVETDQGRDTWLSVYRQALDELRAEGIVHDLTLVPSFAQEQAGVTQQSKAARLAHMLADYERANSRIVHVEGTHGLLEAALIRFPKTKPYDLADAAYWGWRYFRPAGAHSGQSHMAAVAAVGSLPSRADVFAMGRRR